MNVNVRDTVRHQWANLNLNIHMTVCDGYQNTPLGCHVGLVGNISVDVVPVPNAGGVPARWNSEVQSHNVLAVQKHPLTPYVIVSWLQDQLAQGYAAFGCLPKKSHIVISDNYNATGYHTYNTHCVMNMIVEMCRILPDKFGRATLTQESRNMGHGTKTSRIRTLVWIPGYVLLNAKDQPPDQLAEDRTTDWKIINEPLFRQAAADAGLNGIEAAAPVAA